VKKIKLTDEEEKIIFEGYKQYGNKWAEISKQLNGRTDNSIKNFFYSTLRRQLRKVMKKIKLKTKGKRIKKPAEITIEYLIKIMKDNNIPLEDLDNSNIRHLVEYMQNVIEKPLSPKQSHYNL